MNEQLNILDAIDRARGRAQLGIERSARRSGNDWQEAALDRLRFYLQTNGEPFLAEHFIKIAMERKCPPLSAPPDARAFGAVMQTAFRKKIIRKVGYAPANSSNRSPKTLWQRSY